MTSLFQARRRAEEFAAAVDGDAESRAAHGQELTTLLGLVATLRDQASVEPRAEFAGDLRSRLMVEAETALMPDTANLLLPVRPRGRRERRLVAAASAFVLIGGTTTMAAAAQSALPGDALYPIKRGIEQAEAGLSMSNAGKGRDLLSQASDRLLEVKGLVGASSVQHEPRVPETLEAFASSADEGAALLFESFRENGDPESIVSVRSFTAEGIATLESLAGTVPADAQDELAAAALLLRDIDSEATALCGSCAAELPLVEVPDIFLARAEVDRALALTANLELGNDHPVVVPKGSSDKAADEPAAPGPTPLASPTPSEPPSTTLPSPTLEPGAWPTLLPGVDGDTSTGEKSDTQNSTEKLAQDLTGAVETLLPDPDGVLD
jgi:hypothetical protein